MDRYPILAHPGGINERMILFPPATPVLPALSPADLSSIPEFWLEPCSEDDLPQTAEVYRLEWKLTDETPTTGTADSHYSPESLQVRIDASSPLEYNGRFSPPQGDAAHWEDLGPSDDTVLEDDEDKKYEEDQDDIGNAM